MNLGLFGGNFPANFLIHFGKCLEEEGHFILYNQFSPNLDVILNYSYTHIYQIYRNMREIKKKKIKLINTVLDIPPWRFDNNFYQNSIKNYFRAKLYDITNKNRIFYNNIKRFKPNKEKGDYYNIISKYIQKIFNKEFSNKFFYAKNYKNYLKNSDLILTTSKYANKLVNKFLKINCEVFYQCVNSDLLLNMPKYPQKYDIVNVSRIVKTKRQDLIVKAAKRLKLHIVIFGSHQDKSIKLDCPHYPLPHTAVLKELSKAAFYVDASIFEGFGMTPIEAAFLDKISIVSDTFVHKEILENYPLYFKRNNLKDLIEKMKMVINSDFNLEKNAVRRIKKKYSIMAAKKRLLKHIESII